MQRDKKSIVQQLHNGFFHFLKKKIRYGLVRLVNSSEYYLASFRSLSIINLILKKNDKSPILNNTEIPINTYMAYINNVGSISALLQKSKGFKKFYYRPNLRKIWSKSLLELFSLLRTIFPPIRYWPTISS